MNHGPLAGRHFEIPGRKSAKGCDRATFMCT